MEEKTLFTLGSSERITTEESQINVEAIASTKILTVQSTKTKIINLTPSETTTLGCSVDPQRGDWYTVDIPMGDEALKVEIHINQNDGRDARTADITLTQEESGNQIILHLTQEAGVTYTDTIESIIPGLISLTGEKGNFQIATITCYSLGSDGSKVAKEPKANITIFGFIECNISKDLLHEHQYTIIITASNDNTTGSPKNYTLNIICGTASKPMEIVQHSQGQVDQSFTITGLPLDRPCYPFASGHSPQSGGSGITGYLMIHGVNGSIDMRIPCTVNLSTPGQRTKVNTGGKVTVWAGGTGNQYSQIGSFTVPSAGGTVSI